jgi:hypothetical protein
MVRVLFKQEKYRFENTLNKLCVQDKIFHLTDKDVVELSDDDFEDFRESEELAAAADEEYLRSLLDEEADI